jgi:hypothetical protein
MLTQTALAPISSDFPETLGLRGERGYHSVQMKGASQMSPSNSSPLCAGQRRKPLSGTGSSELRVGRT